MKKIRIMHIAQSAGGVDKYIQMLLKYLDNKIFENIIVCSQDFCEENYNGLVYAYEQLEMKREIGLDDIKATIKIRKLIKKYKPNIVYVHSSKAGAIGRMANLGIRNHCIYNPHGWAFNMRCSKKKIRIYTLIEKIASAFCEKIVCISEAEKESALKNNICKENKLQVIFNGVDIESYENSEKNIIKKSDLHIPNDAFIVGMVGRVSQQKSPDIFIKAANLVKKKIAEAYFIIVGNGEMENEIWEYARQNNLENSLYITGWVEKPLNYVELFDVACLLSRWEGFGLVLPEYMMCKKPIIACNVDAIPNIIHNYKNGILVSVDDYEIVANEICNLYENEKLKDMLIKNALYDVKENYDARRVSYEHSLLFKEIAVR